MILRKYYDGEDILGLKVIGGQRPTTAANGHNKIAECGAFIEKVKRGSVADVVGQIRPGKQCNIHSIQALMSMHSFFTVHF